MIFKKQKKSTVFLFKINIDKNKFQYFCFSPPTKGNFFNVFRILKNSISVIKVQFVLYHFRDSLGVFLSFCVWMKQKMHFMTLDPSIPQSFSYILYIYSFFSLYKTCTSRGLFYIRPHKMLQHRSNASEGVNGTHRTVFIYNPTNLEKMIGE